MTAADPEALRRALSGPCKANRLNALKSLDGILPTEVLQLLTSMEEVQTTLVDYRNKERYLEDLSKVALTQSEDTLVYIFHHILGTLYINFEKFWGPTLRVLIELLNTTKHQIKLLHILLAQFKVTNDCVYDDNAQELPDDRPDYVLHRNFILQILAKFINFVETNNVFFMEQMFRFVENELMVSPFIEKLARQNLKAKHDPSERRPNPRANKTKETFITITKIVQSFKNMISVHRQAEFKVFILNLMTCRDGSMQKAAFNCLTAYDSAHLRPYADKILKLLDDKKIRSELSVFSINCESGQINNEHRSQLIPVVHRILFGRMVGNVGKKTSGRDKADKRKSTVMRYVAGCTHEEILGFFELLFEPIYKFASVDYDTLRLTIKESLDIESYVPLNKLQAMISTLEAFLEFVANLKPETLPYLFKMINIISLHVVLPLEDADLINQLDMKPVKTLKILRRSCLEISTEYFKAFPFYKFSQSEVDFIFNTLIWPCCESFVDRNHATVTPILRLIDSFVENHVYHKLIIKRNKSNPDEFLLHYVMTLYDDDKIDRRVSKFIAQMIFKLLRLDDREEDTMQTDEPAPSKDYRIEDSDAKLPLCDTSLYGANESVSLEYRILLQYVPVIFNRLRKNCEALLEKKDPNFRLENSELLVLSALSGYLRESSHCLLATRLLLSTLEHQKKGDLIVSTLKTAQTLMSQVNVLDDPSIMDHIANTLSYQRNIEQRKELCNLLNIVARIDTNLKHASEAVQLMNATSEELVDSPDLSNWNEGFRNAFIYLDSLNESTMNQPPVVQTSLSLLIHQVGFIINTIDKYEFSIRENCSIFYEKLAMKLNMIVQNQNGRMLKQLISETILEKFIKKGLRDTNDSIKHAYIGILRIMAVQCHEKHNVLNEFFLFCSTNQDLDFWLNIKHIQLHNRSKALARLIANDDLQKVSSKTLSSYFMPLAGGFLFKKTYKSLASLSENSIKLIGLICRQLNWATYESTLSYYLDLLTKANTTYQRTSVKLITEILKNFNFDITACDEAMQHEEENKKLEQRMMKRCGGAAQQDTNRVSHSEIKKLNPSTARMVYNSVMKKLIPRLNACLNEMSRVDFEYDKNMVDYMPEKDEIKRIPMAFAIVQLLSLLPGKFVLLRDHLPPLFLKLTTFLRSKNEQTRKSARVTLQQIMCFIGPAYMPDMLRVLKQQLDKGFYVHVLNYTIHSVLNKLTLNYGDLDSSVHELVGLCKQEIFGRPSEDKEISQILVKTSEAKKTKSYDTLLIIASHISAEKLNSFISSIKDLLKTSNESKTVNKLSVCLQRIFTGLSQNVGFPLDRLIDFVQDSIEESIPSLRVRQKVEMPEGSITNSLLTAREDRFLITKDKTRERVKSKINEMGNLHMVVENSLRLLLLVFEKNKILIKRKETLQRRLDGLISLLTTCLKSSSPRCVMRALKCLLFIAQTKIDLPSFSTKSDSIVKKIFILLSLYNGVGMVQGDNYEMIGMCFKTLTLLLLKCEHVQLDGKQIQALMSYIEQDIHDASRQATALRALNSLLQKRCESPALPDIMNKVRDLLVTSSDDNVRSLSIKIWQTYLLEYKHDASALQTNLTKFLRQIDYEYIDGRRSVLRLLRVIVEKFPERILRNYLELFFHLLAQRVVNDDSKEIRETVSRLIGLLLQRLPDKQTFVMNKFVLPFATAPAPELKILGIKLTSILIEANPNLFQKQKSVIDKLAIIVSDCLDRDGGNTLLTYHSLRLYKRTIEKKLISCDSSENIWASIANKLTNQHEPSVVTSCQLLLILIGESPPEGEQFKLVCSKFISLLDRYDASNQIFAYATQALISLGQLQICNSSSLMWLSNKLITQARKEVAQFRQNQSTHRRDLVLRWAAAISQELGAARIGPYAQMYLTVPVRELTSRQASPLIQMSEDLLKFIKSLLGVEKFNEIYSKVQLYYTKKRVDRKRKAAVAKVLRPDLRTTKKRRVR